MCLKLPGGKAAGPAPGRASAQVPMLILKGWSSGFVGDTKHWCLVSPRAHCDGLSLQVLGRVFSFLFHNNKVNLLGYSN